MDEHKELETWKKRKKEVEIDETVCSTLRERLRKFRYVKDSLKMDKNEVKRNEKKNRTIKENKKVKIDENQCKSDQSNELSPLDFKNCQKDLSLKVNIQRKKKTKSSYVPPEYYAHFPSHIPDVLGKDLIVVFIGLNPGIATIKAGHAYAGPTNLFWKLLYSSRIVYTKLEPKDDVTLQEWNIGMTNLVSRPTASSNELSKEEIIKSVPILEEKIIRFCPLSICIVGKGIYEAIYKYKTGKSLDKSFKWGWQSEKMGTSKDYEGALIYVVPSTSGRAATYSKEMKEYYWNILGEWVDQKRKERNLTIK